MPPRRRWRAPIVVVACLLAAPAAADVCSRGGAGAGAADVASRIAEVACAEHTLWHSPFIDIDGRLASMQVAEAESARLRDGTTPAWRRVAEYWRSSGQLARMADSEGAGDCAGALDSRWAVASCRAFLVDTPWSAVFVSFVMTRAGVPGFRASPRHLDYVRDAFGNDGGGPYRFADPATAIPAAGDLLCFARMPAAVFGHEGMKAWLGRPFARALSMHCDIVVGTEPGRAHLVGGNVLQGVTRRILPLNRHGRFWGLPYRTATGPVCGPGNAAACNFNRQDWVAVLKLDPAIARSVPTAPVSIPAPVRECCVACPLPMPPGLSRCPVEAPPQVTPPPSPPQDAPIRAQEPPPGR